jgi:iron complex outermembrane receptor protein
MIAGAELEFHQKLPWSLWDGIWEWEARLDFVRGLNRSDSTNLPRITPLREGLALNYRTNAFAAELELQRSESQGILAPNETPTDAYTFVNLSADAPVTTSFGTFRVLGKLTNLLDAEAKNHVSVLKDLAPLPGRNFVVGLQARL